MKNLNATNAGVFRSGTCLQILINELVCITQNIVNQNMLSVVNEISNKFWFTDDEKITPVINDLLNAVIINGRNSAIHVSADKYGDTVMLQIQDRNNNNGYALDFSIMSINPQVSAVGGSLSFDGKQKKIATVSFSFPGYSFRA